jgi:hypothetical protein
MEALEGSADEIRVFFLHVAKRDFMGKLEARREHIARELEACRNEYDS